MKQTRRLAVMVAAALCSVAGFLLRRIQLQTAFDAMGLPNGKGVWPLVLVCMAVVMGALLIALKASKRDGLRENFGRSPVALVLMLMAAGCMAAGGAYELLNAQPAANMANLLLDRLSPILSIATGLCFVSMAANWNKGTAVSATPWLLPIVCYILRLIFRFKTWSADPIVLDYCFSLLSLVFCLLGALHIGGFAVGVGKRKSGIFFCLCGVFFCAVSLADGGFSHVLTGLGGVCYLAANAWQLLGEKE